MLDYKSTIGIITLGKDYLFTNYGTFFQHLALREYISRLGYKCERIPRLIDAVYEQSIFVRVIRRVLSCIWHIVHTDVGVMEELRMAVCYSKQAINFEKSFKCLMAESARDIKIDKCSNIIVGGDQVWGGKDDSQFGVGRREDCSIISYAVSGDWARLSRDSEWLSRAAENLSMFNAIAVREVMGVKLLKEKLHLEKEVVRVCDPVFLHTREYYESIVSPQKIFARPTLLCYLLNLRSIEDFDLNRYVCIAEKLGVDLKIVGIQGAERYIPFRYWCLPKPLDFLRMLRDADYVLTNSFHGVCFALLFSRQFVCLSQREVANCSQNVRSKELLSRLNLEKNLLEADTTVESIIQGLKESVDYIRVEQKLKSERDSSRDWLKKALACPHFFP